MHVFVCMFQAYLVRRNFQGDEFFGGPLRTGRVERPLEPADDQEPPVLRILEDMG